MESLTYLNFNYTDHSNFVILHLGWANHLAKYQDSRSFAGGNFSIFVFHWKAWKYLYFMDFGVKELLFWFRGFNVLPDKCKKICFNDKNSVLNLNSEYWL